MNYQQEDIDLCYTNLSMYLSRLQYDKIYKYWDVMNKLEYKIEHFDFSRLQSVAHLYDLYEFDEYYYEIVEKNEEIHAELRDLKGRLQYIQNEYNKYIHCIGYSFNDRLMNERLFQLINSGVLI
jgi:hypothetical protein